jgi:uncharacterized protein (DUF1697 family)
LEGAAMTRYVALLRAVNVGGRTVKMDALRAVFCDLGFCNVETFIASGNVLFEASGKPAVLESRIETALNQALGFAIDTFLRTGPELAAATRVRVPAGGAWNLAFLKQQPVKTATVAIKQCASPIDQFVLAGREVHWICATKQRESKFSNAKLEKALGQKATMRSITTVGKLATILSRN